MIIILIFVSIMILPILYPEIFFKNNDVDKKMKELDKICNTHYINITEKLESDNPYFYFNDYIITILNNNNYYDHCLINNNNIEDEEKFFKKFNEKLKNSKPNLFITYSDKRHFSVFLRNILKKNIKKNKNLYLLNLKDLYYFQNPEITHINMDRLMTLYDIKFCDYVYLYKELFKKMILSLEDSKIITDINGSVE